MKKSWMTVNWKLSHPWQRRLLSVMANNTQGYGLNDHVKHILKIKWLSQNMTGKVIECKMFD